MKLILTKKFSAGGDSMGNQFYGFGFVPSPLVKGNIHLCVDRWTQLNKQNDTPILSLDLGSNEEIDQAISELKRDLDDAGRKAKSALRCTKKRASGARKG
jgi:hypothetical protein